LQQHSSKLRGRHATAILQGRHQGTSLQANIKAAVAQQQRQLVRKATQKAFSSIYSALSNGEVRGPNYHSHQLVTLPSAQAIWLFGQCSCGLSWRSAASYTSA
jgi:hypothetical protein